MTGLISKDFIVFKKRFHLLYRAACAVLFLSVILLLPNDGARYIAYCLPIIGVAFLTEIVKVDELSDWKDYLPVLPITSRDIVLSRYVFCALLLAAVSAVSFAGCAASAAIHGLPLAPMIPNYFLGVWFGLLMMCVSIPSGYFFKNEICTGAMMGCLWPFCFAVNTDIAVRLLGAGSPAVTVTLLLVSAAMLGVSYGVSLWIYTTKRYEKVKPGRAKKA